MADYSSGSKVMRAKSPMVALDETYIKTITTLNDQVICQAIKEEDYSSCISLFNQLQSSIRGANYGTYTASKKHQYYHLFVASYNLALVYQQKNDNVKARDNMQKAINSYEKMQGFITNREQNLVFMEELAKTQLQYCGLLSHCDMHQQASSLAEKSLDRIIETSRILQAVCYQQLLLSAQRETTCSSRQRSGRSELVNFKKTVIQQAELILLELAQLAPTHKLMTEDKKHFEKIISKIFSWKENDSNNEKAIKKELKVGGTDKNARNILGIQKHSSQKEYQIGSLMTLTFKNIEYAPHADPLRLLSSHYLKQLAFHSAVAYFTVATESRFSQADLSELRGSMRIDEKYKKLNHDERVLRCKILHLKSLQIAGRLLPHGNALFPHLAQSFCRNYKFVLDEINQVSEMNSTNIFEKQQNNLKSEESIEGEYGFRPVCRMTKKVEKTKFERSKSKKRQKEHQTSKSKLDMKNRSISSKKKGNR